MRARGFLIWIRTCVFTTLSTGSISQAEVYSQQTPLHFQRHSLSKITTSYHINLILCTKITLLNKVKPNVTHSICIHEQGRQTVRVVSLSCDRALAADIKYLRTETPT